MVRILQRSVTIWLPSAVSDRSHFYSRAFECFASCGASTLQLSLSGDFVCSKVVVRIACSKGDEFQLGQPQI